MSEIEEIFDVVDTPKEALEKRELLKDLVAQGKTQPGKMMSGELIDKASDEEVEQIHAKFTQEELHRKRAKTGKVMSQHLINLYSNGVSRVLKIDNVEQLRRDLGEDPIIKDFMSNIGVFLMSTIGKYLPPSLIVCHTVNHMQGFLTTENNDEDKEIEQE